MTWLRCQNCEYEWNYGGDAEHYATCPNCQYKVNLSKQQIEPPDDG